MRVPQAVSTNRALAVTDVGRTALSARLAVPAGVVEGEGTGGRVGESELVRATAPTAIRHAAAAAAVPTAIRRRPRSRRTARASAGNNVSGGASTSAVS